MPRPIVRIIVHHSASSTATSVEEILARHQQRGLREIGYHAVILGDGRIAPGRPEAVAGAHAEGANLDTLAVCLCGDFDAAAPSPTQVEALVFQLTEWCLRYDISPRQIFGHRHVGTTSTCCPGEKLSAQLPLLRTRVSLLVNRRHQELAAQAASTTRPAEEYDYETPLDDDADLCDDSDGDFDATWIANNRE